MQIRSINSSIPAASSEVSHKRSPWRYRIPFVHAAAKAIQVNSAPRKPSAPCLTTYPCPSERATPLLVIARLLEILLPLLLHLFILLLLLVSLNSNRRTRAAVIRSLHPLPFPRQRGLDMRKDFDQSVELFNGERDALSTQFSISSIKYTHPHHRTNTSFQNKSHRTNKIKTKDKKKAHTFFPGKTSPSFS